MERIVILEGGLPWGFRIQGGSDTGIPLRIARVNPGSKASLQGIREGDVITSINGNNSEQLTNAEAHQFLKEPGSNLKLTLAQGNTLSRKVFKTSVTVESKTKQGTATNGSHGNPASATTVGQSNADSTSSQGCNTDLQQNGSVQLEARCASPTSSLRSSHPPKTKTRRHISWDCTKNSDADQAEDVYAPLHDPNGEARKSFIDSMLSSATSSLTRRRSGLANRSSKYVTFQNNEEEPLMESAVPDHEAQPASGVYTNPNFDPDAQLPYCDMNHTLDVLHLPEHTADSQLVEEATVDPSHFSTPENDASTTEAIVEILNDIEYQILQTGRPSTFTPSALSRSSGEIPELTSFCSSHDFDYRTKNDEPVDLVDYTEKECITSIQASCNDSEPTEGLGSRLDASFGKLDSGEWSQAQGISVEELAEFMEFLGLLKQRQSELMETCRLSNSSPESGDNVLAVEEILEEMEGGGSELPEEDGEDMGEYVLEVMDNEGSEFGGGQNLFLKRFLHVIPEEGSELSDSKRSSRALSEMSEMTVNSHSASVNRKSFPAAHTPTFIENPFDLDTLTPEEPVYERESPEVFERYCEIMKRFEKMQQQASEKDDTTSEKSLDEEYHLLLVQDNTEESTRERDTGYRKKLKENVNESQSKVDEPSRLGNANKVTDEDGDEVDTRTCDPEELNEEVDESCLPVTIIDLNSLSVVEQREEPCVVEETLSEMGAEDVIEVHLNSAADDTTEGVSFNELDSILEEIKVLTNVTFMSPGKVDYPSEQEANCQLPDKLKKEAKLDSDVVHVDGYQASNCAFEACENADNTEEMPTVGQANPTSLTENNTMREHQIIQPGVETEANINESIVTLVESPLNILRVVNLLIGSPTSVSSSTHTQTQSCVAFIPRSSTSCPNIAANEPSNELDDSQSFCRSLLSSATARLQSNLANSVSDLTNKCVWESPEILHAEDPTCYPDILGEQTHPTSSFQSSGQHQTFPRAGKKATTTGLKLPDLCESTPAETCNNEKPTSFQLAKQRILALADPKPVGVSVTKPESVIRKALVSELKEFWNSRQALHCDSDSDNCTQVSSFSVPRLDDLVLDVLFRFGTRGTTDGVVNLLYQLAAVLPPKLNAKIRARFGAFRNDREPPPHRNAESVTTSNNEEMPTAVDFDSFTESPPLSPGGKQADAPEYFLNEEHVFEARRETEEMSMSDKYFYDCAASPEGYYFVDNVPFGRHKSLYADPYAYHQEYAAPPVPPPPSDVTHFCSNVSYDPRELANATFSVPPAFANGTSVWGYPSFDESSDYYRYNRVRDDFDYDTDSLPSLPPPPRPPPPEDEWSDSDNNDRDAMSYPPATGIPPRPPARGRPTSQPAPPVRTASMDTLPKSQSTNLHRTGNSDRKRHSSYEGMRNLEPSMHPLGTVTEEKERLKATLLSDWLYHARRNVLRPLASPAASVDSELSYNRCRIQPGANLEPESFLAWRSDNTQSGALANAIAPRTPQRFSQNQETDMSRPYKTPNNAPSPRPVSYLEPSKAASQAASEVTSKPPAKPRPRSFHELEMEGEAKSYAMVQEYQERLAQRAQRKQQGVIKVSSPARPLPRPPQSPDVPFGSDFTNRLQQRREQLGAFTDDEFEAIMREEMHEELTASQADSIVASSSANLPKRLLEDSALFLSQSTEDEDGVWSPGQTQSQLNRSELAKNDSTGEERKADDKTEPIPVWTPPTVRSPSLDRKEFRPVRLDTNTLKKQPSQEREKITTPSASQAYHEETNYQWLTADVSSTAATTPASETSRLLESSRPTSTTPGTPSIASSFTLQSSWSQGRPSSSTLSTPAVTPTSHLPRAPNATVTLLQKAREGQLPKGAAYLESNEDKIYRSPQEKLYTIKREYESEDEQRRKIVELTPKKYTGIGPTSQEGIPLALRTGIQEDSQHQWYRRMYDSLHRAGKQDDYVVVRYKTRGRYPYGGGYQSEPEPCDYNYDSDASYNAGRYSTLDRRRNTPNFGARTGYQDIYRNQPGRIEDFEPGRSSVSGKENKQAARAVPPTRSFTSFALKESGYESDSQLVFRRKSEQDTSSTATPLEQRAWYRDIQKGGDVPLHGLRKPAPDRPQEGEIDEAQLAFYHALLHRNLFEFEKHSMQDTYYPPLFQEPPPYIPPPPPPERVIRSAYAQPPQPPQRRSSPFSSTLRKFNFAKKFSKIMTSNNQEKATAVFYTADEGPRHSDDTKKSPAKDTNINPGKDIRVQSLPALLSDSHHKEAKLHASGSVVKNSKPPRKPTREIKAVLTKTKLFRPIKETKQFRIRRSSSLSSASTPSSPRSPLTRSVRSLSTAKVEKKQYSDDTSALPSHNTVKNGSIHRKASSQTTTTIVSTAKVGGAKLNPSKDAKPSPNGDKTIEIVVKYSPKALQVLHSTPHKSVALTTSKIPSPAAEMPRSELKVDRKSSSESTAKGDTVDHIYLKQKKSVTESKFRSQDFISVNKENGTHSLHISANAEKLPQDTKLIVAKLSTGEIPSPQKIRHPVETPTPRSLVETSRSIDAGGVNAKPSVTKIGRKDSDIDLNDPNFSCDEATAAILLAELENNVKRNETAIDSTQKAVPAAQEVNTTDVKPAPKRETSRDRVVRRESHEYRHYVSELRHSSPKNDRFSQLKSLYNSLERLSQLEKTASCSDLHKLSSEGVIDFEMWRKLRRREKAEEELRTLKLCIVQAQKQGECLFSTKEPTQIKWRGDSGLRIKKDSVDLLREKFEVESSPSTSPPTGSANGENKDSYRSLWRADSVNEVAHKYQKRERLARSQSLKSHFGRGDPMYTSLSLEQINSLKGRLNQLYGSKVGLDSAPIRPKSPSPATRRRYEVLVTDASKSIYRSSGKYQEELYVRSSSDKDKNSTYDATLEREASLRQGKAVSISAVNQSRCLSEAEKKQLSHSLSQEIKEKYMQSVSRRTPPKRSSSIGATTRNAFNPKSSTSAAVNYVRNLSQKLADSYVQHNPPSRLSNSSFESDQSHRSDFLLVLTPKPAKDHTFSDVEDAVREWAQQSKQTSVTRSGINPERPVSSRGYDYSPVDWYHADDASTSSNSSAQTVIHREVSDKVRFFEEKIARAQSPTPGSPEKSIKVYRSVSDLKDYLLYKSSVTSVSSATPSRSKLAPGSKSLSRTQSLPRKLTYTLCKAPNAGTPDQNALTSSTSQLSRSDAKKSSRDDSWESCLTENVFATLPNRKRKSHVDYFTSEYVPEKCVSSMDITTSTSVPPTPPPFPTSSSAIIRQAPATASTLDNSRSYTSSYLTLVKAGDVNQKRQLFSENSVASLSLGSRPSRNELRRQSSLPTVARSSLRPKEPAGSRVTVKGQERGDIRSIKRKYEDPQRVRRSSSLRSTREISQSPPQRSSSLRDASTSRERERASSSPGLEHGHGSEVERLREKFENLSERRARLEARSSYRSLFSSVPSLGAETSPLPTLNWAKRFGTPREIKRGSEHHRDSKRKHVSFPNNLDQFDPPSSPSQTSSSSRRSSSMLVKPTLLSAARMAYLQAKNSIDNGTNFKYPQSRKNSSSLRNINIEPVRLSRRDSLQQSPAHRKESVEEAALSRKESTQSVESTESTKSERAVLPGINLSAPTKVAKETSAAAKPKVSTDSMRSVSKGKLSLSTFDPSLHRPKSRYTPIPDFLTQDSTNYNTFPRSKRSVSSTAPPSRPPPPVDLAYPTASTNRTRSSSTSLIRSMSLREPSSQYATESYGADWNGTLQGASHRFAESQVNIHYKSPIRNLQTNSQEEDEEEMRQRQAEHMRRVYEQERRRKYLQELQDIEMRRHTDNFTPLQKSPIPLNRYDDFMEEQSRAVSRDRERTPEPKVVARALYNFVALNARELSFQKGDIIFVRRQIDKNWYEGEHNALVGIFPVNYVEIIPYDNVRVSAKKPTEGQARAKYNFMAQSPMELSLVKGELVVITRQIDDRWLEGRIGNRKGIFPANYVDIIAVPSEKSMVTASKPVSHPASHTLITNGTLRSYRTPYSVQSQPNHDPMPRMGAGRGIRATPPLPPTAMNTSLHIDTHTEPVMYRALYSYKPQNDDELELEESDIVSVLEKCDDGWYVGTSQRTGQFGTFPGNYVERV